MYLCTYMICIICIYVICIVYMCIYIYIYNHAGSLSSMVASGLNSRASPRHGSAPSARRRRKARPAAEMASAMSCASHPRPAHYFLIHILLCIGAYIFIYTYRFVSIYMYIYIYIYMYIFVHVYIYMYSHTDTCDVCRIC